MPKGISVLLAFLGWAIGALILTYGFRTTKENHKTRDYSSSVSDLSGDSIGGFIFGLVFSLVIGGILKLLPWWLTKTIFILLGGVIILLGFLAIKQVL